MCEGADEGFSGKNVDSEEGLNGGARIGEKIMKSSNSPKIKDKCVLDESRSRS